MSFTNIIEPEELNNILSEGTHNTKIIDATYGRTSGHLSAYEAYSSKHINNAVYFDIDTIADLNAPLPHTIPTLQTFEQAVSNMGISNDDQIIIYDQSGVYMAAARAWWIFRLFGHNKVSVLNGGLPAWEKSGYAVQNSPPEPAQATNFKAIFQPQLFTAIDEINQKYDLVLDARSPERFKGEMQEACQNLQAGHIPGSQNLFFIDLIDRASGKMKTKDELEAILKPHQEQNRITCSCGSGVTACVLALAFHIIGREDIAIYDGSWTEWGDIKHEMPVETCK